MVAALGGLQSRQMRMDGLTPTPVVAGSGSSAGSGEGVWLGKCSNDLKSMVIALGWLPHLFGLAAGADWLVDPGLAVVDSTGGLVLDRLTG